MKGITNIRGAKTLVGGILAPKGFSLIHYKTGMLIHIDRPKGSAFLPTESAYPTSAVAVSNAHSKRGNIQNIFVDFTNDIFSVDGKNLGLTALKELAKFTRCTYYESLYIAIPQQEGGFEIFEENYEKSFAFSFFLGDDYPCVIGGICLGASRFSEKQRTVILTTDVKISGDLLKKALTAVDKDTFSLLSGGGGVNDCMCLLSSCKAENAWIEESDVEYTKFYRALLFVANELCKKLAASDGDTLLRYRVCGAGSKQVARSAVKNLTRITGMSRVISGGGLGALLLNSIGSVGTHMKRERLNVRLVSSAGEYQLIENGRFLPESTEWFMRIASRKEVEIVFDLGMGNFSANGWSFL